MIDKKYIDKVLDEVDLAEVVSDYGVKLQLRGHTAKGCCPFHQEDTPSFHVDTAKNLYHCFGCGKGGNVITFVMEQDSLTFPLAVKKLLKEKCTLICLTQISSPHPKRRAIQETGVHAHHQ
jgi:DNA primase (bacterial type)